MSTDSFKAFCAAKVNGTTVDPSEMVCAGQAASKQTDRYVCEMNADCLDGGSKTREIHSCTTWDSSCDDR
ncbi:hypothetical protein WME73_43045 [Sorangium sp. So ce302]|uniref:hypothetical protein n=1 Tax=unclassified Sorangium TaxID=2621164 RepID=UPI003F615875